MDDQDTLSMAQRRARRRAGARWRTRLFRRSTLCLLRVSLGMLLVWWGAARINNPAFGVQLSDRYYFGLFSNIDLQFVFGWLELTVGLLVVAGLFRAVTLPLMLLIVGFTAAVIWKALIDPFGIVSQEKMSAVRAFFYPSTIILCAALALTVLRRLDQVALDYVLPRYIAYMKERQRGISTPPLDIVVPAVAAAAAAGTTSEGAPAPPGETSAPPLEAERKPPDEPINTAA
ncbi:MAG: hypothetical protein AAFQ88_09645 [Pseudomonadota bacterium]